jgi:hypothetical protein
MSQVHAFNVKASTTDSPNRSCRLVPLRTKGEVEANNKTGAVTRSSESVIAEHSLILAVDVYIVEIPIRSTSAILE